MILCNDNNLFNNTNENAKIKYKNKDYKITFIFIRRISDWITTPSLDVKLYIAYAFLPICLSTKFVSI